MSILRMTDLDLAGKRVLIREDLNVPVEERRDHLRAAHHCAALPTIAAGAGEGRRGDGDLAPRPAEGRRVDARTIRWRRWPRGCRELLGRECRWCATGSTACDVQPGELVLLENCRMNVGEGKDDEALSKKYAALCDVFVMDAFGTAHRAQASTHGVIRFAKVACGGPLLMAELDALAKALRASGAAAAGHRRRLARSAPSWNCCRRWSARSTS